MTCLSTVAIMISAVLWLVIFRVWQNPKVGHSHKMGGVGNEANVQCLIVCLMCAKNHCNRSSRVEVIVENAVTCFWDRVYCLNYVQCFTPSNAFQKSAKYTKMITPLYERNNKQLLRICSDNTAEYSHGIQRGGMWVWRWRTIHVTIHYRWRETKETCTCSGWSWGNCAVTVCV